MARGRVLRGPAASRGLNDGVVILCCGCGCGNVSVTQILIHLLWIEEMELIFFPQDVRCVSVSVPLSVIVLCLVVMKTSRCGLWLWMCGVLL